MEKEKTKVVIGTEEIEVDFEAAAIHVDDLDAEMDRVASLIAVYGAYLGAAKGEQAELDGEYRHWRAKVGLQLLKEDPKTAEAKIKHYIESQERFLSFKKAAAACERNAEVLASMVKALCEKSANLRSRGAWLRQEYKAQGMSTKIQERKEEVRASSTRRKANP